MKRLFALIGSILSFFIGRFSWRFPPWLEWIVRTVKQRPLRVVVVLVLAVVAAIGNYYYQHLPKPVRYEAHLSSPDVTRIENDELHPDSLTIDFRYDDKRKAEESGYPDEPSIANLDLIEKPLTDGIRMEPAFAGEWKWQNDHVLVFKPENDWPADRKYTVQFSPSLFSEGVILTEDEVNFRTPDFYAKLESIEFYQDPVDRKTRRVVATIGFTHAVDEQSLEKKLSLAMRPSGSGIEVTPEKFDFTVNYDKHHRKAYIQSTPISLPEKSTYMKLRLGEGVESALGETTTDSEVTGEVRIPDVYSYFKVESASSRIVRNEKDEPEQILSVSFTDDVASDVFFKAFNLYLLPKKKQGWHSAREVDAAVLKQAKKVNWEAIPNEREAEKNYNFRINVPENRSLYMKVNSGLTSINQFRMANDYDKVMIAPSYPHELKITNEGSVLALSGEHKLGLLSRNIDAIKVKVGRVLPAQINHLISQTNGDISNPNFNTYNFNEENISSIDEELLHLSKGHPKEANYAAFDLSGYLEMGYDYGLFFVTVQGWNTKTDSHVYDATDKRLILVTDLGIIVKDNTDKSHDIFVQSISNGQPVADAAVQLLGKNGQPVMRAYTDSNGHAVFPSTNGLEKEKQPTVYLIRHGNDMSFLPFERYTRKLDFSRFDVGGLYTRNWKKSELTAFAFTDRGIYRPGETVNLAGIVRRKDLDTPPAIPLEVEIRNPRGTVTLKKRITLPELGFFDLKYTTETTSETGYYDAAVYLIRDNKYRGRQLGSVQFQVEEFQPDRLKIKSRIVGAKEKGWISADKLKAEVELKNLFGTPAQDRKVTARMRLTPTGFRFSEFKDYRFDDPLTDPEGDQRSIFQELTETKTDADGIARFELPLEAYVQGTYRLTIDVQGFEEGGGRSVSASSSALLSPLEALVGFKSDGDLSYIHKDSERTINFIAIDKELAPQAMENLRLRLIERQNVSTLVRQENGTYKYQTVVKKKDLGEQPFAIKKGGIDYRLPTDRPGDFVVEVLNDKDMRLAQIGFSVVGHGNLAGSLEKNAELNLKLNKADYRPGETIEMNITAPYTGTGLITIESDRVHTFKWFRTTTTSSMQAIEVPEELEGNAYVNVAFVRAANSPEIYVSPLSYAVAPFTIDRSKRKVEIDLEVPEIARPGKTLKIDYTTSRPARIAIFAIDEGILQVAKYKTPQPLDHFLRKRALEVGTQQMVDLILPEYSLIRERAASGGGMSDEAKALGSNLNPFARKTVKPAVFWSGIVEAGTDQRSVTFDIPETFSGQLRVMAVAVSVDAMGSTQERTLVRGPFVISPNMLTVAAPGDEFIVTVGLANLVEGSGKGAKISLGAEPSEHLEIIGDASIKLNIAEGSEGKADFRFRAKEKPGAASVTFTARMGKEDSRITATMSVRPATPYMASFASGYDEDGKVEVPLERSLLPELATQQVSASASPLVLVDGLNNYLENFPHGCTEQVVSQVFPLIGLMNHPGYASQTEQTQKKVGVLINRLRSRQLPDGGFTLWPGGRSAANFPSVYVMHFLTEAKELGYTVPKDMYRHGLDYLREVAGRGTTGLESARVRAAAIYLLTRNGEVTTNDLVHLQEGLQEKYKKEWKEDLVSVYMAATYSLLKKEDEAESLVSGYEIGSRKDVRYSDFYSPLTQDAQYVYLLANHFPEQLRDLEGKGIRELVAPVFGGHYNTIGSAYTILALGAYSKAVLGTSAKEQIAIKELIGDVAESLKVKQQPFVSGSPSVKASAVTIDSDKPLYYQASQAGFDRALPDKALAEGLEIQRDYLDSDGNEVTALSQGKEVTVRLRIRTIGQDRVSNVAVIDLLPGGFEVIRSSVPRQSSNWTSDYVDVREDRVVFYGSFGGNVTELRYRAKLTAAGEFVVPPAYAEAMYNRSVHGRSMADRFQVSDSE